MLYVEARDSDDAYVYVLLLRTIVRYLTVYRCRLRDGGGYEMRATWQRGLRDPHRSDIPDLLRN